jgi:hypothetical protein
MILYTPDGAAAARQCRRQRRAECGAQWKETRSVTRLVLGRDAALQCFAVFMTNSVGKQFAPLIVAARQMSVRQSTVARPAGKIIIDGAG